MEDSGLMNILQSYMKALWMNKGKKTGGGIK